MEEVDVNGIVVLARADSGGGDAAGGDARGWSVDGSGPLLSPWSSSSLPMLLGVAGRLSEGMPGLWLITAGRYGVGGLCI